MRTKKKPLVKSMGLKNRVPVTPIRKKSGLLYVRSRHPSVEGLRGTIRIPRSAVYRHGSTSDHAAAYEINSVNCVRNCSSKLLMKRCFDKGKVRHLPWMVLSAATVNKDHITDGKIKIEFPIVVKSFFGSRGKGNHKIETAEELRKFLKTTSAGNYIVEPFYSGTVEYRVHITADGPIYSLRKMLKNDVPKDKRWVRNDSTCVWITEFAQNRDARGNFVSFQRQDNEQFNRPANWNEIIEACKVSLSAVGGDILAVDVKAQSTLHKGQRRPRVEFYILEVNSAPAMGEITTEIYKSELPKILSRKYANYPKV